MVAADANHTRPPLIPSEKDNAAIPRRPRTKDITSRYLSYSPSSTSTSNSSSSSTSSSSGGGGAASSRRYPSPMLDARPAPSASAPAKRSQSVERTRPSTSSASSPAGDFSPSATSAAVRALCMTTRSLSVSFQGESFFYRTSKTPSPARRRATTPTRATEQSENTRPQPPDKHQQHRRWPAAKPRHSNPLARSLDRSLEKRDPVFAAVRLLHQSITFEDRTRRTSFDASELSASSDTDSVSSGSNSGAHEQSTPAKFRNLPRGISVPARFWQEAKSRTSKVTPVRSLIDSPNSSPRSISSPHRGHVRPSSPSKIASSHSRGMASPLRGRMGSSPGSQPANAPSIISFAAEVRRAKKGESRIEEAHLLRLYDNRLVQWRWVNARTKAALLVQEHTAEENLYNSWLSVSELRDSVTIKRIKLQLLTQHLKLTSILKGQMAYLEAWSSMDRDHSNSLSGAIEALKASTLRLPVVGGARAKLQDVKDAVGSAVDVMQAMGSSLCSFLSKVEATTSLVCDLAKMVAQERALLDQSRYLLSTVAAIHVKQCSLRGHLLQKKRKPSMLQL